MTQKIDEMLVSDAIRLYYEKHNALRQGDMIKLLEIKKNCPDIFIEEKDREIRELIEHAKIFQNTEEYRQLKRLKMKEKLILIRNNSQNPDE